MNYETMKQPTKTELKLEVERLRGELEALKLEHLGCKPLYSRRKLEAQLAEATALLVRVDEALESDGPWLALQAQLRHWLATRAPAQPAAPTPDKYEAAMRCASSSTNVYEVRNSLGQVVNETRGIEVAAREAVAGGPNWTWRMKPAAPTPVALPWDAEDQLLATGQPAAPEPSAEPVAKERYLLQCEVAESLRVKLLAAESQLAAVNEVAQRAEKRVELYPGLKGSTYYAAYLEILALLVRGATPAPSPGADPGRSGK